MYFFYFLTTKFKQLNHSVEWFHIKILAIWTQDLIWVTCRRICDPKQLKDLRITETPLMMCLEAQEEKDLKLMYSYPFLIICAYILL